MVELIVMAEQESPQLPPPGMIVSLTAGFEAIASNVIVILLPILLDLFLWLGPRLRIETWIKPRLAEWLQLAQQEGAFSGRDVQQASVIWDKLAQINLLGNLHTFPLGVSSLLAPSTAAETPFGPALVIEINSFLAFAGWTALLVISGWLLGSVFYFQIAGAALKRSQPHPLTTLPKAILQTLLLNISWWTLACLAGIPLMLVFAILAFINTSLAQFFIFFIVLIFIWLLLPIYFSTHGIFVYGQNAFSSIMQSLRLVRFTMPSLGLFALLMIVINEGLNYLWRVPQPTSWMTLVGILAHAFISSALLAASFIYYRDMNAWLQMMLERLRTQPTSARA